MFKRKALLFLFIVYSFHLLGQNTLVKTSDDNIFRTGLELINHEKYSAARATFQSYVNLNKNDLKSIDAEYYIAFCAMNLFNADAETLFEEFILKYPYHSKSVLAYYELGNFNFNNKKYEKAIQYFEKADLQRLSDNQKTERNFRLAYSYFSQKDFEKAEPLFNSIKISVNKHTYAASYYAGFIETKNGNYAEAISDLKKAEENENYQSLVPVMLANIYYRQGSYDELINYSEKTLKGNDTKTFQGKDEIFLLTADAYFKKGDYVKSAEYFKKYKSENKAKASKEIIYRLALSEYKIKDFDNAISDFKDIAGYEDSIAQSAAYYLGISYLKKNNKEFALTAFELAGKPSFSKETQEEALFNYAKVNYDLQRFHDAITALKSFSKEFPKSNHVPEVQDLLSESFLRTSNYSEALSYIESLKFRSSRINTAYQRVAFYSGVKLFNEGKYEDAIQVFDKSSDYPIDKDILLLSMFWKGEAYSALKDYNNAIKWYSSVFQKTDERNEYHLKSRYGIGYAYFNTKQYDKALPHFKAYVEKLKFADDRQFYDDAILRLADLYYQSKKYDDAIRYYNDAIAGKINDMDYAYYQRGVVYGILDKISEAKNSLDLVIKNYPQSLYNDDAIFENAQLDFQEGNLENAVSGYSKIINEKEGSPYVPYSLIKRAGAYTNLNKNEEAIKDYENILTHYVSHPVAQDALLGLQDLYEKTGRGEEFKKWIDVMESVDPKNSLLVTARFNDAKNLYTAEKYKPAIDAFQSYLKTYPDNANSIEARYYLADSYVRVGEIEEAIKNYQLVLESKNPAYYAKSLIRIADLQFKKGSYADAKIYYSRLLESARNKKDKSIAWTGLMESSYLTANYDSTIYFANEIKNSGSAAVDAESKALLFMSKAYYAKQDITKALDYFINTVNFAKNRNGAEAQYLIAEIQYNQKKYRQSLETLYQMNNLFSEYDDWIGKAFLLVSENFISLNEIFQAKATLNSIIDNSADVESVEKAKKKLIELQEKEGANE